ncbi:MAG: ABC transporter ATP-binding protein [Gammaproteobacteria bacterium]|nr:ABC transporter ATP-binding protein [Gammaproteobacteria bacterium]
MIELRDLSKEYQIARKRITVLDRISLSISSGDYIAVTGPSGAGKSTLMSIIGCLDKPTSGEYRLDHQSIYNDNEDELARIRRENFGFVFQSYNLIPRMTILQNVQLPMIYAGISDEVRRKRGYAALNAVGLGGYEQRHPGQLSGGQQQRAAIARALVNNPPVIIADEPTGSLDKGTANDIIELFDMMNKGGKTILYVTHDPDLVRHASRVLFIDKGKLHEVSN